MPNQPTDEMLLTNYLAGDESALNVLIRRYTKPIFSFVYRMVGKKSEAEDITQETFIKFWRHAKKYRKGAKVKTWLFQIARNTAIDWLRKKHEVPLSTFETDEGGVSAVDTIPDTGPMLPEIMAEGEDIAQLKQVLEQLRPAYREVLLLHYAEDLTFDEIGRVLKASPNTVKSHHRRAILELRKLLLAPKNQSHS